MPYNIMIINKTRGRCLLGVAIAWRLAAYWSTDGNWWLLHCAFVGFFPHFAYRAVFISTHGFFCFYPSDFSSPAHWGGVWVSSCVVLSCMPEWPSTSKLFQLIFSVCVSLITQKHKLDVLNKCAIFSAYAILEKHSKLEDQWFWTITVMAWG